MFGGAAVPTISNFAQSVRFGNVTVAICVTAAGCLAARLTESERLAYLKNINFCSVDAPIADKREGWHNYDNT